MPNAHDLWVVISEALGLLASLLSDEDDNIEASDVAAALTEAGSVISRLMVEAESPAVFHIEARGALAIQLARLGVDADSPPPWIAQIRNAALSAAEAAHRAHWRSVR